MRRFIVPLTMLVGFIILVTGYIGFLLTTCAFQPGVTNEVVYLDLIDVAIMLTAVMLLLKPHRTMPPRS